MGKLEQMYYAEKGKYIDNQSTMKEKELLKILYT